ncbi:MAG TPA: hypothetical protein VM938_10630 [Acidimicrobiales bacterium]|nr:hypothetical protein [Acidimicrobiales bacterium]
MNGVPPAIRAALRGKTSQCSLPAALAADATKEWPIFMAERPCKILSITVVPQALITGANANTFHWNVKNRGTDGLATTEIGNVDFVAGTNAAAFDGREIVNEVAGRRMTAGQVLTIEREKIGTGIAAPEALVVVAYEYEA